MTARIGFGAAVRYAIDPLNNYFSIGGAAMQDSDFPGAPGKFFTTYDGYQNALRQAVNGAAYSKFVL